MEVSQSLLLSTNLLPSLITSEQGWGVGQPAEIREAYVVLAGPGGDYITGMVIHVNGGVHIGGA
jgi:NAD(P)-dependent dehydrogenase (short-subunit alcohol dehydrogenase family)